MSKKYLKDEDEYDWDDDCEWDERYDEFDDSYDDDDDDRPRKKKQGTSSGSRKSASGTSVKSSGASSSRTRSAKGTSSSAKKETSKSASGSGKQSGKKLSARRRKKRRRMILICVLEVLVLCVLCGGLFVMSKLNRMQRPGESVNFGPGGDAQHNDLPSGVIASMQNYTTYAVFGLDKRDMEKLDDGQSDVILLVSVNNQNGEINMVSVYRDTYLQIEQDGTMGKINAAYNRGGAKQAIEALNTNLDLCIDHYVTVNWYAVAKTIDLMGGVEMEISDEIFYAKEPNWGGTWLNSYIEQTAKEIGMPVTYPEGPGYQTLTGLQAVALCRIRQVGMDYGRTENQRQVVSQVFEKAKKMNVATLIKVADSVFPNIQTDLQNKEIAALLPGIAKYWLNESAGFPSARDGRTLEYPWMECIIPKDLITNVAELHQILYHNDNYAPSDTVININEKISSATGVYK